MHTKTPLAPRDAGHILGLTTGRLAQLDREGVLPALKDSAGRRSYDPDAVEAFKRSRDAKRLSAASTERTDPPKAQHGAHAG